MQDAQGLADTADAADDAPTPDASDSASKDAPLDVGDSSGGPMDAADGGLLPGDEPCFTDYWLNCSDFGIGQQCSPTSLDCAQSTCGTAGFTIGDPQMLPFEIRLPSHPPQDPACKQYCVIGTTVFAVEVKVNVLAPAFRVTVASPWKISVTDLDLGEGSFYCLGPDAVLYNGCAIVHAGQFVDIATTDTNAPARNVRIESVPAGTTCP